MTPTLPALLETLLVAHAGDAVPRWLEGALAATPANLQPLLTAYTAAPRLLGRGAFAPPAGELQALTALAPDLRTEGWTLFDAGRALLLMRLADQWPADAFATAAVACYEQGDAREQQSWLKALSLLPQPERFLPSALDACRTNIIPVFEAIACENPFPGRYFPELHFNQLVLRSLFVGVALDRIVGRAPRLNPTLTQMAQDFAAERRAAGRPVPADLHLALLG